MLRFNNIHDIPFTAIIGVEISGIEKSSFQDILSVYVLIFNLKLKIVILNHLKQPNSTSKFFLNN